MAGGYKSLSEKEVELILMEAPRGSDPKKILDEYIQEVAAEEALTQENLKPRGGATEPATGGSQHVVVEGDTLSKIAEWYGTTPEKIAAQNKIKDVNKIKVGQKLNLRNMGKK